MTVVLNIFVSDSVSYAKKTKKKITRIFRKIPFLMRKAEEFVVPTSGRDPPGEKNYTNTNTRLALSRVFFVGNIWQ